MFRGISTVTYAAHDVAAARDWYTDLLGVEAYFAKDFAGSLAYVEFRIGDHLTELGLLDARYVPGGRPADPAAVGSVTYWAVDDVRAAHRRLLDLGCTEHGAITEQGPGFVTASVIDPFGNVLGVMYNQHYLSLVGEETAR